MTIGLRELKKKRVRQHIINTTKELIQLNGFEKVTVEQISREVEITPPTFYNYFSSKDAVLGQIYADSLRDWASAIDEQLETDASTESRLQHLVTELVNETLADAVLWKTIINYGDVQSAADSSQRAAESLADGSLLEIFRAGQKSGELSSTYPAELLQAMFDGAVFTLCYGWAIGEISDAELKPAFDGALDLCLNGMISR